MKKTLVFTVFSLLSMCAFSQKNYNSALGLRFGANNTNFVTGVTGKHFLSDKDALEGIVNFGFTRNSNFVSITGLYERHATLFGVPEINGFYGAGGGLGFTGNGVSVGIDGITGVEYSFLEIPINVSIDVKPYLTVVPEVFLTFNSAFSVRYYFK